MSIQEIAAEIVKSAIENNAICFDKTEHYDNKGAENRNAFNSKQIADFYKTVVDGINATFE